MAEVVFRFIVGGIVISTFAVMGDVLKPQSFAGLFGAAPSVALATLSLTILSRGKPYAAVEARSMIAGALAFIVYAFLCMFLMKRRRVPASEAATLGLIVWFACALGAWWVWR